MVRLTSLLYHVWFVHNVFSDDAHLLHCRVHVWLDRYVMNIKHGMDLVHSMMAWFCCTVFFSKESDLLSSQKIYTKDMSGYKLVEPTGTAELERLCNGKSEEIT